jgi:hypothetical protein
VIARITNLFTTPGECATTLLRGRLQCSVEISASADPMYEGRGGEGLGMELGKALERSLLGASAGGMASLSAAASGERGGAVQVACS